MLKPYSTRNEFLLTLIAGGMCALAEGFSDHLAKPTRWLAYNGVLSGGSAGVRFGVRRGTICHQTDHRPPCRAFVRKK